MVQIEQDTVLPYQKLHLSPTRWRYNECNRVFACNFHILNNTFAKLISIFSLNRAGFSDIEHAHFCCTFHLLKHHICKNYFFKLLLQFKHHLPETLQIESPDVSDEKLSKNFGTPKNLLVLTKQSFLLAKKHIVSYFGQIKCF